MNASDNSQQTYASEIDKLRKLLLGLITTLEKKGALDKVEVEGMLKAAYAAQPAAPLINPMAGNLGLDSVRKADPEMESPPVIDLRLD